MEYGRQSNLNLKQREFCNQYLLDFNATQAAIRAGYSEKSAYSQAHDLLKKPEIQNEIERLSREGFKAIGLSVNRIVTEIASIAFSLDSTKSEKLKALDSLLKYEVSKPKSESNDRFKENAGRVLDALTRLKEQKNSKMA